MKNSKICKILSVIMIIAFIAAALPWISAESYAAAPANYTTITVNETKSVSISGNSVYFKFVPTVSGKYEYYSFNRNGDPYGYILDSSGNTLTYNDDGGDDGRNFSMSYNLSAGSTYYLQAKCYSNGSGSYSITIKLVAGQGGQNPADSVEINAAGPYSLFNSGCTGEGYRYSSSSNYDATSYTNGGYDIYAAANTAAIRTVNLGLSFEVNTVVTGRSELTIYAFDVDESSGERDLIYLVDETDNQRIQLSGYLSADRFFLHTPYLW